jgi:CSLREA domain-containing protein
MLMRTAIHPLKILAAVGAAFLLWGLVLAYASSPAWAATINVDSLSDTVADDEHCTLREAINSANSDPTSEPATRECANGSGADTITFDSSLSGTPITLASQLPVIVSTVTIDGGSADITVSGNNAVRVFFVDSGAKLTLSNLTVANGQAVRSSGGGINNQFGGTVMVNNSTFSGNSAPDGSGGGIYTFNTVTLKNTIVANSPSGGDVQFITDGGGNLDDDATCDLTDPSSKSNTPAGLDPADLKSNGGPTETIALCSGVDTPTDCDGRSVAIDAAVDCPPPTTDQRGVDRPQGSACDIGAFEFEPPPDTTPPEVTCSASPSRLKPPNHKLVDIRANVEVTDEDGSGPNGFRLVSVTSSQPDSGLASDDVPNDIQGWTLGDGSSGLLRAERYGDPRVYTLTYEGEDVAGDATECDATVTVPKGR